MVSDTTILMDMFYQPRAAFLALRDNARLWAPLLVITLGTVLLYYWYYATVDFNWLMDHMLAASPDLNAEQRATARGLMTPSMLTWSTVGFTLALTPLLFAVFAVYYLLVGKFLGSELRYRDWLAYCVWTAVPRLLVFPLMALQIVKSNGQVALEDLSMVSLNMLFFQLPNSHPWAALLSGFDLTVVWSLLLAVIGLRVWTGRGVGTCAVIALVPLVLIYGLWAIKILAFS